MTPPDHIHFFTTDIVPSSGYSHIVKITGGQTIYLAGQASWDASGNIVGKGNFRAQAQYIFEHIKTILATVGADFSHVVKLNFYLLDRLQAPLLREVRDLYVNTQAPPVSTLVEVPSLFHEDFLLEVEVIASLPS